MGIWIYILNENYAKAEKSDIANAIGSISSGVVSILCKHNKL